MMHPEVGMFRMEEGLLQMHKKNLLHFGNNQKYNLMTFLIISQRLELLLRMIDNLKHLLKIHGNDIKYKSITISSSIWSIIESLWIITVTERYIWRSWIINSWYERLVWLWRIFNNSSWRFFYYSSNRFLYQWWWLCISRR